MPAIPTLPWPAAFALCAAIVSISALAFGRSRARLALSCLVGAAALVTPWLTPAGDRFPRALIALLSLMPALRIIDLSRDRREWSGAHRVWLFISPFDTRETERVRARLDLGTLGAGLAQCAICALMVVVVQRSTSAPQSSLALAARLGAGVVATYTLVGGCAALTLVGYRTVGIDFPPVQRMPIASRSLTEFWGERWNRTVNRWLRRNCFVPLARRGLPRLGVASAFLASALAHVWLILAALGTTAALSMGAFFVVEAALLVAEGPLRVRHWRRPLQHAWAVTAIVAPSPLFILPMTALLL